MFSDKLTKRVLFVGIPDMAYVCLDGLKLSGVNIVGVLGPKRSHQTYYNFKRFVESKNLNFIEYEDLDDPVLIHRIKELNPDIAVVCSFNYKVPKVLLESVKDGFINVHPSLLPKYRGANPYSAAIINNEAESGVTLHFMDEGFDTGDIISQVKLPLSKKETMGTLFNRTNLLAFNMLLETLKKYETSELPRIKQPQSDDKNCKAFKEDASFIDYSKSAAEIECFIRGLNPFINATTNFRQNIVKVYSADVLNEDSNEPSGTIVKMQDDKFYISTKKGLIAPTSLQFGSFFIGTSKDFIEILSPKLGERFI